MMTRKSISRTIIALSLVASVIHGGNAFAQSNNFQNNFIASGGKEVDAPPSFLAFCSRNHNACSNNNNKNDDIDSQISKSLVNQMLYGSVWNSINPAAIYDIEEKAKTNYAQQIADTKVFDTNNYEIKTISNYNDLGNYYNVKPWFEPITNIENNFITLNASPNIGSDIENNFLGASQNNNDAQNNNTQSQNTREPLISTSFNSISTFNSIPKAELLPEGQIQNISEINILPNIANINIENNTENKLPIIAQAETKTVIEPLMIAWDSITQNNVSAINQKVNHDIRPLTDLAQFGKLDYWFIPEDEGSKFGDCEDYALQKRSQLIKNGIPQEALSLAIVITKRREFHVILIVSTIDGDMVLDNLSNEIKNWKDVNYKWVAQQSRINPLKWNLMTSL